jgi:hypothetical protein
VGFDSDIHAFYSASLAIIVLKIAVKWEIICR